MAMRRPKKLARPTGASSASRLGPGMETMELTFVPDGGWAAAVAAAAARTATALPPRWVISWEVGPGATVDRGLKLAKLHCVGVDENGGPGDTKEHFIVGESQDGRCCWHGQHAPVAMPCNGGYYLRDGSGSRNSVFYSVCRTVVMFRHNSSDAQATAVVWTLPLHCCSPRVPVR